MTTHRHTCLKAAALATILSLTATASLAQPAARSAPAGSSATAPATAAATSSPAATRASAPAPAATLSFQQLADRLTAQGFHDIREIERKSDKLYEVKARDAQGRWNELDVDARSGEVLRREIDRF